MIDAFAGSLVRHRARWTVGAVLVLLASVLLGARLTLRHALSDFLPRGAAAPPAALADLGGADRIAVVIESDRAMTASEIGPALDSIAARLAVIPGVRRVEHALPAELQRYVRDDVRQHLLLYFSPAELDSVGSHLSRAYLERALLGIGPPIRRSELAVAMGIERTDPLGVVGPALRHLQQMVGSAQVKLVEGYFAVPDQQTFFMTVEPRQRLTGIDSARAMVRAIDRVLEAVRHLPVMQAKLRGKRVFAIGRPVAVVRGIDFALHDVQRVGLASTILVFGLLVVCLRRLMAPLLIVGTVLYGIAVTAGVAFLVFKSISLLSWVFIASLIGFGDEFALYVIAHYWLAARPGADRAGALASALRRPGIGLLLGGLTSAAAFFSLVVMSYPVMVEVAWLTTIGLLLILGCSFTVLPLALAYTPPGRDADSGWYRWAGFAHRIGKRRQGVWLTGWIALVAGSLLGARTLRFDLHPWKLAVRGIPVTAELDRIAQRMGVSFTPFLMVSRGSTPESALAADRAAVRSLDSLRQAAGVAAIVSLSQWVPSPELQRDDLAYVRQHADLFSPARFRRDFTAVAARMPRPDTLLTQRYLPLVLRYLDDRPAPVTVATLRSLGMNDFIDRHLIRRPNGFLAVSDVYLDRVPWADGAVDQFTGAIARDGSPALHAAQFVGDALRGATRASVLRRDAFAATGLALALTLIVLIARFRRPDLVLLCLLPLVCGLSAALGVLALLHIDLNILTLAAAPLLVGLGSDDGIHMVDRLERREPVDEVMSEVGAPMTITTLTTIAGFACFGFARFPGVRAMGLVCAWGLLVCLAASLQLVPMCYVMLRGRSADAR